MFMGFCKRSNEQATMQGDGHHHRPTLAGYTPELLTHLTTLSAGITIVAYLFYVTSPRTVEHFGTNYLVYTLPLVIYAIARCVMLSMKGFYSDPTELILRDRPLQLVGGLWIGCTVGIIFLGRDIQAWLGYGG
jgi:hypothetical protein